MRFPRSSDYTAATMVMAPSTEELRVAIEAVATLAHVKRVMVTLLLEPAGVPVDAYRTLLQRVDPLTGRQLTKRQLAPLLFKALESRPDYATIIRNIIRIAAEWTNFALADNEFEARATVQKARELYGMLELMDAREAEQREQARQEALERIERERAAAFRKENDLLLMMFDSMQSEEPTRRGYLLQDLLNRLFTLHDIEVVRSFTRNDGGEQIDGAFRLEGWNYLVECRWRNKLADIRDLDGLKGKVDRSGRQTMGLFLSYNGWSEHVVPLLKQNSDKAIVLMDGYDLRSVLSEAVLLRKLLVTKSAKLSIETEPFFSAAQMH